MIDSKKISVAEVLARFGVGCPLLAPLTVSACTPLGAGADADGLLEADGAGLEQPVRFVVEAKTRATPQVLQQALEQVRRAAQQFDARPLILAPYLAPERLAELERAQVSGVDLCGNGVVTLPGRLLVLRTGAPNAYRDSRPLNNPYRGRSAMVGRMILERGQWESLGELAAAVAQAGGALSMAQVSKAVQAMAEDLVVAKGSGKIWLQEPAELLEKLGAAWRGAMVRGRKAARLPAGADVARLLGSDGQLRWALTGASSVSRWVVFGQGGARCIAVSNLALAERLLGGTAEPVPAFADVELWESEEAGFYFGNQIDAQGMRWASPLQSWLELQAGDARQREAAGELRARILAREVP